MTLHVHVWQNRTISGITILYSDTILSCTVHCHMTGWWHKRKSVKKSWLHSNNGQWPTLEHTLPWQPGATKGGNILTNRKGHEAHRSSCELNGGSELTWMEPPSVNTDCYTCQGAHWYNYTGQSILLNHESDIRQIGIALCLLDIICTKLSIIILPGQSFPNHSQCGTVLANTS